MSEKSGKDSTKAKPNTNNKRAATSSRGTRNATKHHSQSGPIESKKETITAPQKLPSAASSRGAKNESLSTVLSIPIYVEITQPHVNEFNAVSGSEEKMLARNTHIVSKDQGLLKSYISGGAPKERKKGKGKIKGGENEVEMDFLSTVNINTFGNFMRIWGDLYFGADTQSAPCRMLIDTGSSLTWINKDIYKNKCVISGAKSGASTGLKVVFKYGGMKNHFIGDLYEDTVSFGTDNSLIKRQRFALVDESKYPDVRNLREKENIMGIIGLESGKLTRNQIIGHKGMEVTGIVDNLLHKYSKEARIIGIDIKAPSESTLHYPLYSAKSMDRGELHFGGFKRNIFAPNEPVWASMDKISPGLSPGIFAFSMKIKCRDETVMDTRTTIYDTGAFFSWVPSRVMNRYLEATEKVTVHKSIHWDNKLNMNYILRKDINKLVDLTLVFEEGTITLPPSDQVISSAILKRLYSTVKDDRLYLSIQPWLKEEVLLGLPLSLNKYFIFDTHKKKVGIVDRT